MNEKGTSLSLLLGTAAFVAALLALAVTPGVRAATTFSDPAGDAGVAAPDVTAVDVSNAGRTITMIVHATGVATKKSGGYSEIEGVFNADKNVATGDEIGIDYFFRFASDSGVQSMEAYKWDGEGFATSSAVPTVGSSEDAYTFTFSADALGISSAFDFFVIGYGDNEAGWSIDVAPDMTGATYNSYTYTLTTELVTPPPTTPTEPAATPEPAFQQQVTGLVGLISTGSVYVHGEDGLWHYIDAATFAALGYDSNAVQWFGELPGSVGEPIPAVVPAPVTAVPRVTESVAVVVPAIGTPATTPVKVVAGKTVKVSFPVTDQNTGSALTTATMIGNPKVNGVIVKHVEHFGNGLATITLKVPKAAKGKQLKVALTIRVADQSASKLATFRIG
jgi:hypothetical protein